MKKEKLYDKIINNVAKEVKKVLNESISKYIIDDGHKITKEYLYPKDNSEDLIRLNSIKKELWNFFNDGYQYAGLDGFSRSCYNGNSLKKNANHVKLVFCDNDLIAASVYSGRDNGYKCVGITATTNIELRKIGIKYVHEIVQEDIMNYSNFFWTICSGSLEKIYEEYGGIKVPNEYLHLFKMFVDYEIVPNDDYHIMIKLNDGELYQKTVYGFNSKESLDAAINVRDQRVLDRINRIKHINESSNKRAVNYSNAEKAMSIINIFYEERCNGMEDLSQVLYDILIDSKNVVEQHLKDYVFTDKHEQDRYEVALENAKDIIDSSTLIKIHKG